MSRATKRVLFALGFSIVVASKAAVRAWNVAYYDPRYVPEAMTPDAFLRSFQEWERDRFRS